jgi:hypothetical protein
LCWVGLAAGEVVDLAEWKISSVELTVRQRTPVFATREAGSARAYLAPRQRVTLLQWSESHYYVEGRAATGPVRGWVNAGSVTGLPAELAAELQRRAAAQAEHRELIARQEVAVGMTRAEVLASLGAPQRRETVAAPRGPQEVWFYLTYRYQPHLLPTPDAAGPPRQTVTYRRVAVGRRWVRFEGERVVALGDEEAGGVGP